MNNYVIFTSQNGWTQEYWNVDTNMTLEQIKEIDSKYGCRSRFCSTGIKQLKEGANKEGFTFEYVSLKNDGTLKKDYIAHIGNY